MDAGNMFRPMPSPFVQRDPTGAPKYSHPSQPTYCIVATTTTTTSWLTTHPRTHVPAVVYVLTLTGARRPRWTQVIPDEYVLTVCDIPVPLQ